MESIFKGLYTALITPFSKNGEIDYSALYKLIDQQLSAKIDGIVILGTTGESPTISGDEKKDLIQKSIAYIDGRSQVVIGTGTNCTKTTIENSIFAEKSGADGLLVVNPYYNKPTQKGLYEHFKAVAESVNIPVILYNIKGRTGVNIETPTLLKLAEINNIVSVKEASGDMEQIKTVIKSVPKHFTVLSGDDDITMELIRSGGHGVVSVTSNIVPCEMKDFVQNCIDANFESAITMYNKLSPLFSAAFIETNPQPIKTLLAYKGLCEEIFRLPLTTMEPGNKERLLSVWNEYLS